MKMIKRQIYSNFNANIDAKTGKFFLCLSLFVYYFIKHYFLTVIRIYQTGKYT